MEDKEKIYDEEIKPLMRKIIECCKKNGIPVFATFQYSDNFFCTTAIWESKKHAIFDYYEATRQCIQDSGVNVDRYILWLLEITKGKKHSSIFIDRLGNKTNGKTGAI